MKWKLGLYRGLCRGFPKIRGTILGVPIIRITVFLGSMLGSPYLGKLPLAHSAFLAHSLEQTTGPFLRRMFTVDLCSSRGVKDNADPNLVLVCFARENSSGLAKHVRLLLGVLLVPSREFKV